MRPSTSFVILAAMFRGMVTFTCACLRFGSASQDKVLRRERPVPLQQKAFASFLLAANLALAPTSAGTSSRSTVTMRDKTHPPLALFLSEDCIDHDMGPGHPEAPERLEHLIRLAKFVWSKELDDKYLKIYEPEVDVTFDQLIRVHTPAHLISLKNAFDEVEETGIPVALDRTGDTAVFPGTQTACLRAAGLVVAAVDKVLGKDSAHDRAFVMARPPGHHAEANRAMGFCFFNNVMVGVAHAEEVYGIKRIAILDFDVHHGNGDEAISRTNSSSRLYASSHQVPLFPPGDGKSQSDLTNNIINVPLPPGAGSFEFRAAWRDTLLPAVKDFSPEMVFISAGFDAHEDDPMASLKLNVFDFDWVTRAILEVCSDIPVVSVLEGGYDIDSLGESAHVHVQALSRRYTQTARQRAHFAHV